MSKLGSFIVVGSFCVLFYLVYSMIRPQSFQDDMFSLVVVAAIGVFIIIFSIIPNVKKLN